MLARALEVGDIPRSMGAILQTQRGPAAQMHCRLELRGILWSILAPYKRPDVQMRQARGQALASWQRKHGVGRPLAPKAVEAGLTCRNATIKMYLAVREICWQQGFFFKHLLDLVRAGKASMLRCRLSTPPISPQKDRALDCPVPGEEACQT